MENASKALIIAGSVLIALLIIGALLLMFNSLSSYQEVQTQEVREAQVVEFNNQYETYLRNNVRGSDMISLMNRIIDYNTRKANNSEENFQKMKITITNIKVSDLKHEKEDTAIIKDTYTEKNIGELLKEVQDLESEYQSKYITALSANISKVNESPEKAKEIFPESLWGTKEWKEIKKDTASYYQYTQFKRLYFDCDIEKTEYDSHTGRIINMEFTCNNKMQ